MDDPIDGTVLFSVNDVFALGLPVVISKEVLVGDSVYVDVSQGFDRGSNEVGLMTFGVGREREEEFLGLVEGFLDGDGLVDPIDGGVDIFQPGKS